MTDSQSRKTQGESLTKISILKNPVQEYDWGSGTEIQDLLGLPRTPETPMAELWMGAHPKDPSKVMVEGEWKSLKEVIEKDPESVLGKEIAQRFSRKLPFLFKVLAAARPLSVQVHPNLKQAREGFVGENSSRIPLEAPERNFKDDNHKPEIICALTCFHCLVGFREIREILSLMSRVCRVPLSNELNVFRENPDAYGLKSFLSVLMTMEKERQAHVMGEALNCAEKLTSTNPAFHWMRELNRWYPGDIGGLSPLYLNPVRLNPGEAIYLPAGELHSYLGGAGIELMANSDNVLRGGMTSKHKDIHELLRIVNFKGQGVKRVESMNTGSCETIYPVPAEEFLLSVISGQRGESFLSPKERSVEILICVDGTADIRNLGTDEVLPITRGTSVIVPASVAQYRIDGEAILYKASVPL